MSGPDETQPLESIPAERNKPPVVEEADATDEAGAKGNQRVERLKKASIEAAKAERAKGEKGAYIIYVNGQRLNLTPIARGGRTLVPLRRLSEFLGATVDWEPSTKTVTVTSGDTEVQVQIGSNTALVNGEKVTLDVVPEIDGGSTFVPLRFIAEALGALVDWDPETGAIVIITQPDESTEDQSTDDDSAEQEATANEPADSENTGE